MRTSAAPALDAASYSSRPAEALRKTTGPEIPRSDRGAVDVRQAVVEDDDVGRMLPERTQGGGAVGDRLDDLEPRSRGEQEHEGVAVDLVVLDEQDADRLRGVGH